MLKWRWTNFTVVRNVLPTQKRYRYSNGEIKILNVVVLCNNYQSRNLIGPNQINLRNLTLFTRLFLARRCVRAGHKNSGPTEVHVQYYYLITQWQVGIPSSIIVATTVKWLILRFYLLCADNHIPCSLENKFEVSSCSTVCVHNWPEYTDPGAIIWPSCLKHSLSAMKEPDNYLAQLNVVLFLYW